MKRIFILIGLCLAFYTHSQEDFKEGFIIQNNGDTLKGFIDFRSTEENNLKCTFKTKDGLIAKYKPFEILGYRIANDRFFISKKVELDSKKKEVFVEYILKGKINLYFLSEGPNNYYFVQKESDSSLVYLPYSKQIVFDKNYGNVLKTDNKYKGVLKCYLEETPNLYRDINKISEPTHENLIELLEKYHNAICSDQKCILYKKQTKLLYQAELFFGMFSGVDFSTSVRDNEKISISLGASRFLFEDVYTTYFNIKYIYPKRFLRPLAYIGIGYCFNESNLYLNVGVGLQFDISQNIALITRAEIQNPFVISVAYKF